MTITIGWWIIPAVVSIVCGFYMAQDDSSAFDGGLLGALFMVPVLAVWLLYFMFRSFFGIF